MAKQKPAGEIKLASIRATIWQNPVQGRIMHSVTFSRLFREEGAWRDASSFSRNELLIVARAAGMAFDWIVQQQENDQPPAAEETVAESDFPSQ